MTKPPRWRVTILLAALFFTAVFLLFVARKQSLWHVSLDFSNWRIYGSESMEFSPEGVRIRTTKAYHIGPLTISLERVWEDAKPRAVGATSI